MVHLQTRLDEIRRAGGSLVTVGSGGPQFAAAFREELGLDFPVLSDTERQTYGLLGLKRGVGRTIGIGAIRYGVGAFARGERSKIPRGDLWQQGGAIVVRPDGSVAYQHANEHTGDHVDSDALIAALAAPQAA